MNLTKRHNEILRAALSYAYSNVDDINDAMSDLHLPVAPFTGEEIADLQNMLGQKASVGAWVHCPDEKISKREDVPAYICRKCVRIAFPSA